MTWSSVRMMISWVSRSLSQKSVNFFALTSGSCSGDVKFSACHFLTKLDRLAKSSRSFGVSFWMIGKFSNGLKN